jgi:hypothetical protein
MELTEATETADGSCAALGLALARTWPLEGVALIAGEPGATTAAAAGLWS